MNDAQDDTEPDTHCCVRASQHRGERAHDVRARSSWSPSCSDCSSPSTVIPNTRQIFVYVTCTVPSFTVLEGPLYAEFRTTATSARHADLDPRDQHETLSAV